MAEASGSGASGPSCSYRYYPSSPGSPIQAEAAQGLPPPPRDLAEASSCACPQSPIPSARLHMSRFFRKSPEAKASRKTAVAAADAKSNKGKPKNTLFKINKLPRYLWAAFGRVRGPLKRHLKRRKCGRSAKRAYPWSKARCVSCLFNVQWFEAAAGQDEVSQMMAASTARSPRPNKAARRAQAANAAAAASQPAGASLPLKQNDCQSLAALPRGRRRLFPDVADERPRRLSDIMEEEEEERQYIAEERDFAENYSAELPENGEYEQVDRQQNKNKELVRVGEKRKAATELQLVIKPVGAGAGPSSKDDGADDEDPPVVRRPVRRRLF
ncbi:hypothetical protein EGW08_001370 [Elysia chlorotica]|uniref:Uncharacterized protein n=1 Tax=Elysia chlorotica TaxID=188477 RepID=A0A433UAM9_ELYCH|nr:hypothetical protein EGW08_001370 [Elysia chlorotica]